MWAVSKGDGRTKSSVLWESSTPSALSSKERSVSKGDGRSTRLYGERRRDNMWAMNPTESALRAIKDRVAAAMGELDEAAANTGRKANRERLQALAAELHRCADDMQNIMMRVRTRP